MKSMTGFGKALQKEEGRTIDIEMRSVNHRYRDINIRLPRVLQPLEEEIRNTCEKKVKRGKMDVFIHFRTEAEEDIVFLVNEQMAKAYQKAIFEVVDLLTLGAPSSDVAMELLLDRQDIITPQDQSLDGTHGELVRKLLFATLEEALDGLISMRKREGEALKKDMLEKQEVLLALLERLQLRAPIVLENNEKGLREKLDKYQIEDAFDENRVLTEIVIFSDRVDIDEEIVRLQSHIKQLGLFVSEKGSIGRKLDFLLQEINREINTIASKGNDLEIANITIEMKDITEKIREQVQNIE